MTAPNGLKVKSKFLGIEKYKQVDKKRIVTHKLSATVLILILWQNP